MAQRMASDGYLKAGYEYIIVDDCWLAHTRDANNKLQPDPVRFPSGIRALADFVHSLGLKFGIYEDYGTIFFIFNLPLKWSVDSQSNSKNLLRANYAF